MIPVQLANAYSALNRALRRVPGARRHLPDLVELAGLAAIVYAISLAYTPAAYGVGGILAVVYANVHELGWRK